MHYRTPDTLELESDPEQQGEVSDNGDFEALLREAAHVPKVKPRHVATHLDCGTELLQGRFELKRFLGKGGMGVVYEAEDRESKQRVALKTLSFVDATGVYRLKQEFRALADVAHRNLVGLHELFCDQEHWFFSMDLIQGVALLEYLAQAGDGPGLKGVFSQLAQGIDAIHQAGKLHRDLKPNNVMVTGEQQVVIMDFGLVSDQDLGGIGQTVVDDGVSGTPHYMAPEQAALQPASRASDWYAFGVILFEALTGRVPFQGSNREVLSRKQKQDAPRPSLFNPSIADDLDRLCTRLLSRIPDERPDFNRVMSVLGRASVVSEAPGKAETLFVGREAELGELSAAFEASESDVPIVLFVHGPSGVGKTALVERFLNQLQIERKAAILRGRCYERESLPYKACDSLIDALSRYLRMLPRERASNLLPRQVHALARLFPAIERLEVVAQIKRRQALPVDPVALRRQAFIALKELLANMVAQERLVLYVDDLQWSDVDGAALLSYLLSPPEPPALLLIGAYRSEEADRSDGLGTLRNDLNTLKSADLREIALDRLSREESEKLALEMLPESLLDQAEPIATESAGSPFFITELVRYASIAKGSKEKLSLERVIESRVAEHSIEDQRLLEAVCVSAGPAAPELLGEVADIKDIPTSLRRLHAAALIRYASGPSPRVTAYHDRIREIIITKIEEAVLRDWHSKWAGAIEKSAQPDLDALSRHYSGAGDKTKALVCTERAADQAAAGLSFDYASNLYQQVLALLPEADSTRGVVFSKLGQALADAGRSKESARVFVNASEYQNGEERVELRWRAAEQALLGGDYEFGIPLLRETLPHFGIKMPANRLSAIMGLIGIRTRLRFERPKALISEPANITKEPPKVKYCTELGHLLFFYDPLLGLYLIHLAVLYGFRSSDPSQRAVGTIMQAIGQALLHPEKDREIDDVIKQATDLARKSGDAESLACAVIHACGAWMLAERPLTASEISIEADRLIRQHCTGAFSVYGARLIQESRATNFIYSGEYRRQRAVLSAARTESLRHGSVFHDAYLGVMEVFGKLAMDDPIAAKKIVQHCIDKVAPDRYTFFNIYKTNCESFVDTYRGYPEEACRRYERHYRDIRKSGILRAKSRYTDILWWRGIADLAAGLKTASQPAHKKQSQKWLALARTNAKRLKRLGFIPARAASNALFAGLALHEGKSDQAIALLRESAELFEGHEMLGWAAAARRSLGLLMDNDQGRELIENADAKLIELGVVNPPRWAAAWFPGFDNYRAVGLSCSAKEAAF